MENVIITYLSNVLDNVLDILLVESSLRIT